MSMIARGRYSVRTGDGRLLGVLRADSMAAVEAYAWRHWRKVAGGYRVADATPADVEEWEAVARAGGPTP
jgi:hypothetical protein